MCPNSAWSGGRIIVRRPPHHVSLGLHSRVVLVVAHARDADGELDELFPPLTPLLWPILVVSFGRPVLGEVALGLEVFAAESGKK